MTVPGIFSEAGAWQECPQQVGCGDKVSTVLVALDLSCMTSIMHSSDIRHSWPPISCYQIMLYKCILQNVHADFLVSIHLEKRDFNPLPTWK